MDGGAEEAMDRQGVDFLDTVVELLSLNNEEVAVVNTQHVRRSLYFVKLLTRNHIT